jgi:glycosyltransferase involved in cell wall biosynthesis
MSKQPLAVVIPAFNEATTIVEVVSKARKLGDVIVIDDGSSDGTAELADSAGATVLRMELNKGYERALESGVRFVVDEGYQFLLTMDADGQHRVESAQNLIKALGMADVAIGVRKSKARISEWVAGWIGTLAWGVSDPFSGLKLYRLSTCASLLPFDTYRLCGGEMLVRAHRRGLKLITTPIDVDQRIDAPRFGLNWRANLRLARAGLLMLAIDLGILR